MPFWFSIEHLWMVIAPFCKSLNWRCMNYQPWNYIIIPIISGTRKVPVVIFQLIDTLSLWEVVGGVKPRLASAKILHFTSLSGFRQLRARRALKLQLKDVPLRTRRVLLLYIEVYGDSALLVLNWTSLICNNALLALGWRFVLTYLWLLFFHSVPTFVVLSNCV